jgi:hypothetical protein
MDAGQKEEFYQARLPHLVVPIGKDYMLVTLEELREAGTTYRKYLEEWMYEGGTGRNREAF